MSKLMKYVKQIKIKGTAVLTFYEKFLPSKLENRHLLFF